MFLTFDCYGTLVDWRSGIVRAFHGALPEPVVEERILALHAEIEPLGEARARVRFDEPVSAVSPGQAAVFYSGDAVLGGGWIAESCS